MRIGTLMAPTLRVRITACAVLASLVFSVAVYVSLLALLRSHVVADARDHMHQQGQLTMRLILARRLNPRLLSDTPIQVLNGRGDILSASVPMAGFPRVDFPPPGPNSTIRDGRSCEVRGPGGTCFLVTVYRLQEGPRRFLVYILTPEPGLVPNVGRALLLGALVPMVLLLTGYGTWTAIGRALRPVEEIRAEMNEITATDLQRRVPVAHRKDEIARLAECVNDTLDRLESAVARLRGFVSDVSHELRSPLTGLRMELELALSDTADEHTRETLETLLGNALRLQDVLDDLLVIARLESGPRIAAERVELQELADHSVLIRPRRATFTVEGGEPVVVRGGRSELGRLLNNLIDNADRHAASRVTMTVHAETAPDGARTAVVEVSDDGPGVAPEDRERVFERFTRLSEGRHRDAGGTGLGLAISRDIATAHGGTLVLTGRTDGLSGARFVLRLPALPPGEEEEEKS